MEHDFKKKLEIKFNSYIHIKNVNGCIEWGGHGNRKGYGYLYVDGVHLFAHRASYILKHGEIGKGLLICHTCDNPKCVNIDHLWPGTHLDNSRDKISKGRFNKRRTQMIDKQPYVEQLREIRDTAPYSMWELADLLGMQYETLKRIFDPNDEGPIREVTVRKIKAFITKFEAEGK